MNINTYSYGDVKNMDIWLILRSFLCGGLISIGIHLALKNTVNENFVTGIISEVDNRVFKVRYELKDGTYTENIEYKKISYYLDDSDFNSSLYIPTYNMITVDNKKYKPGDKIKIIQTREHMGMHMIKSTIKRVNTHKLLGKFMFSTGATITLIYVLKALA